MWTLGEIRRSTLLDIVAQHVFIHLVVPGFSYMHIFVLIGTISIIVATFLDLNASKIKKAMK